MNTQKRVSIDELYGLSIVSTADNDEVDIVVGSIIHREKGVILAFYTARNKLLSLNDIQEIHDTHIVIESDNELLEAYEYPLLQPYLDPYTDIIDLPVYHNTHYKGRIIKATMDRYTGYIIDITVRSGHFFWATEHIYTRAMIHTIDTDKLFIDVDTTQNVPIDTIKTTVLDI